MKKILVVLAVAALAVPGAYANFCARDVVPAATLLFPFVAVSTDALGIPDPNGQTTITDIVNASREAIIVHYTVWSILSEPLIDFDEVLSGYDVHRINWRDFLNGRFDLFDTGRTNLGADDPFEFGPDGRSQAGGLTTPQDRSAIPAASLPNNVPPYGSRPNLAETIRQFVSAPLSAYQHDGCGGVGNLRSDLELFDIQGANPLVFYVTADVVSRGNLNFPTDTAYWEQEIATNRNQLLGWIYWLNAAQNFSESAPAVHVEAATDPDFGGPQVLGFYEEAAGVETNREPLATALAFPYFNSATEGITSNLIFWKNQNEIVGPISDCGAYVYYAWDMDEHSLSRTTEPISGLPTGGRDPNQLPFETQMVPLNNNYFDLPGDYGWMLVVLPPSYGVPFGDPTTNPSWLAPQYPLYFGWAGVQVFYGTYSTLVEAATMANAHCFSTQTLNILGNNDGTPPLSILF